MKILVITKYFIIKIKLSTKQKEPTIIILWSKLISYVK